MEYREAYKYINSFTNYEHVPGVNYTQHMDGLERVQLLMRLLGTPHDSFKSVVIAGTKGKGSVAAMIAQALVEAGYKTGLYTSPHLHTLRERIQVSGQVISPEAVARITEQLRAAANKIRDLGEPSLLPSTYELITALAFLYFEEVGVQIAVLEVGLGGRLDAVNVTRPLVSVITAISMDHMDVLGDTIEKIAAEKAGIIKPGGRVISAPQSAEAMSVLKRAAVGNHARLSIVGNNVYVSTAHLAEVISDDDAIPIYQAFTIAFEALGNQPAGRMRIKLPLLGSHQQVNAAVALAALRTLNDQGLEISQTAMQQGFANTHWPGRFEIVNHDPVVVVDGAHNSDSMSKLMQAMHDLFYGRSIVMVLATSRDKDLAGIVSEIGASTSNIFGPRTEKVIITKSKHARAADPQELAEIVSARGLNVEVVHELPAALVTAERIAAEPQAADKDGEPAVVLVTGSLFAVAEAREHYGLAQSDSEEA